MLIRSQDKTALVKFENIVVSLKLPDSLNVICWSWQDAQSEGYFILGKYSTREKAMKVLDMIQEAYADEKLVDYTKHLQLKEIEKMDDSTILALRNELMKKAVFQMPEDSEVEV